MATVFPPTAGGRARQNRGSMGAVSGAPLTVSSYTKCYQVCPWMLEATLEETKSYVLSSLCICIFKVFCAFYVM